MGRMTRIGRYSAHKSILEDSLKKKQKIIAMYGQCIRSIDREFISEDTFLWLSMGDLKEETERSCIGNKNIMQQKHYKQKQTANAYYVSI